MDEILTRTISLNCSVEHAFDVFTGKIDLWWPLGHRKHRDGTLRLDAGALIDRSPDGAEWTMATIAEIDPPSLLRLDWYPGSPAAPTSVEIRFIGDVSRTEIVVTHRPLLETKSIWPQRVELFERGWNSVLPALKAFIEEE
ncbi:MAG: SRPBCC domain-containing protein [Devosia sp.]